MTFKIEHAPETEEELTRISWRRATLALCSLAMVALPGITATASPVAADAKPPGCSDGYQVGGTAYAEWRGITVASVKQYWSPSCKKNWGYVWIWESFIERGVSWVGWIKIYDQDNDQNLGIKTFQTPQREAYSIPVSTGGICTRAALTIELARVEAINARTDARCG